MINKQSLWFITLFSLILILGIYYVSMPSDALKVFSAGGDDNSLTVDIKQVDGLVALKASEEEKMMQKLSNYQEVLLDTKTTTEQKNEAYEMLSLLNLQKGKSSEIQKLLKNEFNVDTVVSIDKNNITITISSEDKGNEFANNVITSVQKLFTDNMYITVKFK